MDTEASLPIQTPPQRGPRGVCGRGPNGTSHRPHLLSAAPSAAKSAEYVLQHASPLQNSGGARIYRQAFFLSFSIVYEVFFYQKLVFTFFYTYKFIIYSLFQNYFSCPLCFKICSFKIFR